MQQISKPQCNIHSPEQFDEAYGARAPVAYAPLLATIVRWGKPGKVVDLGAGLGLFAELCWTWGLDVIGLEGSGYGVKRAQARAPSVPMLIHDLGDPLPFASATVSNVILNQVIEHIEPWRYRTVLKEAHRVLEPGGVIFIASPSRRNRVERCEPTHINMKLPSELVSDLQSEGFMLIQRADYGFWLWPTGGRLVNFLASGAMKVLPRDWISSTANAIARKPD